MEDGTEISEKVRALAGAFAGIMVPLLAAREDEARRVEYRVDVPMWGDFATCRRLFDGLSYTRLCDYVERGLVKKNRSGAAKQAKTVYCIADLDRVYAAESVGRTPRAVRALRGKASAEASA